MAKQIYSFTKIEKKRTRAGIWTTMFGFLLIIALLLLVVVSVYLAGKVPMAIASMGMFTFLLSILNYMVKKFVIAPIVKKKKITVQIREVSLAAS